MPLSYLDHVNLRTARLVEMRDFYVRITGLTEGPRPPFAFGGAWMYCGDRAVIHLVEVDAAEIASPSGALALEHFALRATGFNHFIAALRAASVPHRVSIVPGFGTRQVNFADPDGNHLHVDFAAEDID
jgi:catechol 2,3-dioxygenase-like lactoylglutathione lyase family enzyme